MSLQPTVSIIIPTYNAEPWLGLAVESALAQTYTSIEVLVFDNASTDGTPMLMSQFDDPRLTYARHEENVGFAGNVTRGIKAARGDFLMVLGADDILEPAFLEEALHLFETHPDATLLHGNAIWIDDHGVATGHFDGDWAEVTSGEEAFIRTFTQGFCYSTVLSRSAPVKKLGAMDEDWGMISDTWLFLKLCLEGNVLFLAKPLVRYRVRESSLSFELYADGKMFNDHMRGLEEAFSWPEAQHIADRSGEARKAVAEQAFATMHMTRIGAGLSGMLRKSWQVVRACPSSLGSRKAWLRFIFACLPPGVIVKLRDLRKARNFEATSERSGLRS